MSGEPIARIGDVYDVWWELIGREGHGADARYVLRNTANGNEVSLSRRQMRNVATGKQTVSRIRFARIKKAERCGEAKRRCGT